MKHDHKLRSGFKRIKQSFPQLKQQAASAKKRQLWHLEAVIRNQVKRLQAMPSHLLPEYQSVYKSYTELLDHISARLLEQYNQKNHTNYQFEDIVSGNPAGYLKSGIIAVLVTNHIPKMVSAEFRRLLPQYPQNEYPQARRQKRTFYLHLGDTNTGKTYHALQRLKQCASGVYLAPLRILALENFERLSDEGVPCSLLTGEEEIRTEGAGHLCCTVEKANLNCEYEVAVLDEVQLLEDLQRGDAWTRVILGLRCPEIHLCGARLAKELLLTIIQDCGDNFELKEYTRLVPLQIEHTPYQLSLAQKGDALVAFSKRSVLRLSRFFADKGVNNSVIYGDLPPEVRRMQYEAFIKGDNPILIATDAIGMGVNLPIRRLVFTETEKFDGESFRPLSTQEVKQIAGRAGRIGIYDVGYVASLEDDIAFVQEQLEAEDEPTQYAVIGPSEAILQIGLLPLEEKLALWSAEPETLPYYRKKDISNEIFILHLLRPYRLPEPVQWRLMKVPFDPGNEVLLNQFMEYARECFTEKREELTKPFTFGSSCAEWETYYQQVNLYYSFSKTTGRVLDEEWVLNTRGQISKKIHLLLQQT